MELLELKLGETTEIYYLFTIKVKYKNFWGITKTEIFPCMREIQWSQSKFISNGKSVYQRWLNLDNSINAILSTKEKYYKKD